MKTRNTAARTLKSAARSTRKPSAVKVRRVKGAALAPPVVREPEYLTPGCTPEIDAEARALFPDLPFVIRTADGKEITSSVPDMRQEIYRLRRVKGDTLTAGSAAPTGPTVDTQLYAVLIEKNGECFLDEVAIPNVTDNTLEYLVDVARANTDAHKGTRAVVVGLKVKIPMPPKSPTYLPIIDMDNPNAVPEVVGVDYMAEQKQTGARFDAATGKGA
jgi:hypothetical protein